MQFDFDSAVEAAGPRGIFLEGRLVVFFARMNLETWTGKVHEVASSQSSSDAQLVDLLSISESEDCAAQSAFWAPWLKRDSEGAGFQLPRKRLQPLRLVSCCTGSFAEAAVLEDGGEWRRRSRAGVGRSKRSNSRAVEAGA